MISHTLPWRTVPGEYREKDEKKFNGLRDLSGKEINSNLEKKWDSNLITGSARWRTNIA